MEKFSDESNNSVGQNKESLEKVTSSFVSPELIVHAVDMSGLQKSDSDGLYLSEETGNSDFDNFSSTAGVLSNIVSDSFYYDALVGPRKILQPLLSGIPIVDIGAGIQHWVYRIAQEMKASGYIGVEPYNYRDLYENLKECNSENKGYSLLTCPLCIVAEDMLRFLKRLPDNSVNITAFSIDNCVLSPRKVGLEYTKLLQDELLRVLHPNGVFLSSDFSDFPPKTEHRYRINDKDFNFDLNLFTKSPIEGLEEVK